MPIPYAIDPSLHSAPPRPRQLDDGFRPPAQDLATHPVEPEAPEPGGPELVEPNTSRLPVEPEFAPDWRPVEPEDPGTPKPPLP